MPAAVLLLHELPDGSAHFDWLIQRPGGPDAPLISYRVGSRIDQGTVREFTAVRLPNHRAAYLTYEGEVSGGRGRVLRMAGGELEIVEERPGVLALRGSLGKARGRFQGTDGGQGMWMFAFAPEPGVVH